MNVRNNGVAVTARPEPVLSIDEFRLLVFVIWCARVLALLQRVLPEKFLPPKDERIPPLLLHRLIRESKKLVPRWTRLSRRIPLSAGKLGWQFFLAVTAIRLSRAEIWRAGHRDAAEIIEEVYSLLCDLGVKALEKKQRQKAAASGNS
jgi:hypothetical protein